MSPAGAVGNGALEYVHDHHVDTAAIIVTGTEDRKLIDAAFAIGAFGYVVKPYRVGEILISLSNALHRMELEKHNRSTSGSSRKRSSTAPRPCGTRWPPSVQGSCLPSRPRR